MTTKRTIDPLTIEEKQLSRSASEELGFPVIAYRRENWKVDPCSPHFFPGFGMTARDAIDDCKKVNEGR
jgi:hypothetical protein